MKKIFLFTLILTVLFVSCNNNSDAFSGYDKTETGLFYKFYNQNVGDTPSTADFIDVDISCAINDTLVLMPINRTIIPMQKSMFTGDIYEGFAMMTRGDTASFIVRTDSTLFHLFRYPTLPPGITSQDVMKFEVKLNDFYPESELMLKQIGYIKEYYPDETIKAETELRQYLIDNKIDVEPTASGLYYVKTKDGDGIRPTAGTNVKVHYTGKLLDGTVFDSSKNSAEPFQFMLGVGQVIRGWDEGLQLMTRGEKGILYIPFYLAYVDRQAGIIPPFSTLVFEVELVDF